MAHSRNSSYMKAVTGLCLIAVIVIIVNMLGKNVEKMDMGKYKANMKSYKNLVPFEEKQKDSVSKLIAGFWVNDKPADKTSPAVSDRIEMKDNGIVWRTITYKFPNDSNDTSVFIRAFTAWVPPFASNIDTQNLLTFDVHIIRQTFAGIDTCYDNPSPDTTWIILKTADGFEMDGKKYTSYDTTDLAHFFPEGAVAMVDAVSVNPCKSGYITKEYRDLALPPETSLQNTKEKQ